MAAEIKVERNPRGGAAVTFVDNAGFVSMDYLSADQVIELIAKLQGTWTPENEAEQQFGKLELETVHHIAELDGDSQRRELARYELDRRAAKLRGITCKNCAQPIRKTTEEEAAFAEAEWIHTAGTYGCLELEDGIVAEPQDENRTSNTPPVGSPEWHRLGSPARDSQHS